ncbi:MAG TPA: GNAT family N-acetyltransferase [Actinomycetes bacterium]|nr:GNAT family N-acetyltransferase [Actinomycetes bacterium]
MTTITIPTPSTQRLTLRGFAAADLDALAPIYADPQGQPLHRRWHPADRAATWRALAGMLGHWQLHGYGMWALIERATGRLIGPRRPVQPGRTAGPGGGVAFLGRVKELLRPA